MKNILKSVRPCLKETIITPIMMIGEVFMEVLIPYIVSVILGILYIIDGKASQANAFTLDIYNKFHNYLGDIGLI